jgi:hypothetical protein
MIGVVLLAQAAQSSGVAGQASSDMFQRALADLTSAFEAAVLSLVLIILVCVNSLLGFRVYASSRNSCGCSKCRGRSMCQALLGAALNTVAFFLSAWRHIDTIGPQGHPVSDAVSFFLIGITLLSPLAALAFGVAGINILMDAPRIGAQCPLAQGDVGDSATSTEDGGTARWESQAARCGSAWEVELSSALLKR